MKMHKRNSSGQPFGETGVFGMKTQICKWICRLRLFVMSECYAQNGYEKSGKPKAGGPKREAQSGRSKAGDPKREIQSGRQKAQDFTVRGELRNESEQSAYL
jgi:hypothetical protein